MSVLQLSVDANGAPQVAQRHVEPMVYLDHWALRRFSEDGALAERLHAALAARGGTLALSWTNLGEFAKMAAGCSVQRAEDLLEALVPHVFFLNSDPFKVIECEDKVLSGAKLLPHADQELLAEVIKLKPPSVRPITVRGLLDGIPGSVLVASGERLADIWVDRVSALRTEYAKNKKFREDVRTAAKTGKIPWATRFIVREFLARFLVDPSKPLSRNDGFDWFHTVVPLAYCQAVLLDGHWTRQAEIVVKVLTDAGSKAPMAAVFSGRGDGVDRFLREVEA